MRRWGRVQSNFHPRLNLNVISSRTLVAVAGACRDRVGAGVHGDRLPALLTIGMLVVFIMSRWCKRRGSLL